MTINNFITDLITDKSPHTPTTEDKNIIQYEGIEKYIYKKLNSSKYRATKTTEDYDKLVREKISYCVKNRLPIHVDLSTGATKNPRAVTAPGIDWAEVFNVAFIREYLKPIAAAYKYGVLLDYFSVAIFEEKVNSISQKDVDLYDNQLNELIKVYQNYLPENLILRYRRLSDLTTKEVIYPILDEKVIELRKDWEKMSEEEKKEKIFRAERNVAFGKDEPNYDERILNAILHHEAFGGECWAKAVTPVWNELGDISLGHRYTDGWAIHVRSAAASTINFWSGVGLLIKKGENYIPTVLSPNQFNSIKNKLKLEDISFFGSNQTLRNKLNRVGWYNSD